ncbi:MAG: thiosulfate oxidation carrier protein SoxY [Rhodomicrobium sp.]
MKDIADASRRDVLRAALTAAALVVAARSALAEPADVEAELKKLFGGKPIGEGKIKLDIPQIAENGLVVPINFEVESPMTPESYVKSFHVFADGNPNPQVFTYHFTPESGRAAGSNRMRLARTENVIAVAEMSDGTLYTAKSEIKVTIGGCGG